MDAESRSNLGLCNLHHRSIGVQNRGCYTILYHTIPYYTILYHTIPYYTTLYQTIPYYTRLYHTIVLESRVGGLYLLDPPEGSGFRGPPSLEVSLSGCPPCRSATAAAMGRGRPREGRCRGLGNPLGQSRVGLDRLPSGRRNYVK